VLLRITASAFNDRGPVFMEQVLAALHQGIRGGETLSLNLLRDGQTIATACDVPAGMQQLVTTQLLAHYPSAKVERMNESPAGDTIWSAELTLRPEIFPIKRHPQFRELSNQPNADPLSGLLSALAGGERDPLCPRVELIVCPASHRHVRRSYWVLDDLRRPGFADPLRRERFLRWTLSHRLHLRALAWGYPRVLLVLDEATNANLVGAAGHEVRALAECQKMGLDIHVLVQSLNFPSAYITDGVLTNCTRHEWFYAANAAVARKAAEDLGDPELEDVIRRLKLGQRYVKERDLVFHNDVPKLPNPWIYPQLAERKVQRAIAEIRRRPEYVGDDECPPGATVTPPSSNSPPGTSAAVDTSSVSSPARRRRTAGSKRSASKDSSDLSAPSSPETPAGRNGSSATAGNRSTTN
jgi:hypothetical protein